MLNARIITIGALTLLTGTAAAFQPERGGEQPARQADDATVLRGPRVDNAERPDRGERARERDRVGERMGDAARPAAMPFQAYLAALRSLQRGEDESLRLTPEQAEQVRAIAIEHREAMKAFVEEHKAEIDELRAVIGENRVRRGDGPAGGGDGSSDDAAADDKAAGAEDTRPLRARNAERRRGTQGGEPVDTMEPAEPEAESARYSPEDRAAAREKLRALMTSGAQEQQARTRLLAVLTEAQRERVEAAIKAQAERMRAGRGGERVRPEGARRPDAPGRDAAQTGPERAPSGATERAPRARRGRDGG